MDSFKPFSLNLHGRLLEFTRPAVMGIINVTPDSFYAESRVGGESCLIEQCSAMLTQGADILDIGGYSTRPGHASVSLEEELRRVVPAIEALRKEYPSAVISVDTFRGEVARRAVAAGADIINDVGAMTLDPDMERAVVELKVPYILMHPAESSITPSTPDSLVATRVVADLQPMVRRLTQSGVADIIIDPGFGFGKTVAQNFALLRDLAKLQVFELPILVGLSRKSMLREAIGADSADGQAMLTATTAAHTAAILAGAAILRVHDVEAAKAAIKVIDNLIS